MKFIDLDAINSYLLDGRYIVYPPRRGHWIDSSSGYAFNFCCSECGFIVHEQFISDYKYCPHCGARMDEVVK